MSIYLIETQASVASPTNTALIGHVNTIYACADSISNIHHATFGNCLDISHIHTFTLHKSSIPTVPVRIPDPSSCGQVPNLSTGKVSIRRPPMYMNRVSSSPSYHRYHHILSQVFQSSSSSGSTSSLPASAISGANGVPGFSTSFSTPHNGAGGTFLCLVFVILDDPSPSWNRWISDLAQALHAEIVAIALSIHPSFSLSLPTTWGALRTPSARLALTTLFERALSFDGRALLGWQGKNSDARASRQVNMNWLRKAAVWKDIHGSPTQRARILATGFAHQESEEDDEALRPLATAWKDPSSRYREPCKQRRNTLPFPALRAPILPSHKSKVSLPCLSLPTTPSSDTRNVIRMDPSDSCITNNKVSDTALQCCNPVDLDFNERSVVYEHTQGCEKPIADSSCRHPLHTNTCTHEPLNLNSKPQTLPIAILILEKIYQRNEVIHAPNGECIVRCRELRVEGTVLVSKVPALFELKVEEDLDLVIEVARGLNQHDGFRKQVCIRDLPIVSTSDVENCRFQYTYDYHTYPNDNTLGVNPTKFFAVDLETGKWDVNPSMSIQNVAFMRRECETVVAMESGQLVCPNVPREFLEGVVSAPVKPAELLISIHGFPISPTAPVSIKVIQKKLSVDDCASDHESLLFTDLAGGVRCCLTKGSVVALVSGLS